MSIKKAYHYLFYKYYRFFQSIPFNDVWLEGKAGVVIMYLQMVYSLIILLQLQIHGLIDIDKHVTKNPLPPIIMIVFIHMIPIYTSFYYNQGYKRYITEFKNYSSSKSLLWSWIAFLLVIFAMAGLVLTFYQMSVLYAPTK